MSVSFRFLRGVDGDGARFVAPLVVMPRVPVVRFFMRVTGAAALPRRKT